jgi:hypothetical protein
VFAIGVPSCFLIFLPSAFTGKSLGFKGFLAIDMASSSLLVEQTPNHSAKRLMLRSSITIAKKISKLHRCAFAAGRLVGFMKDKQTVALAAEKPSVTVRM